MTISKEGYSTILISFTILLIINFLIFNFIKIRFLDYILLTLSIILFFLIIWFFRIPNRFARIEDKSIIAPSDGKIVIIEKVFEPEYFKDERIQISIFMSPLNVHAQWFPINGKVTYTKYHPGKYLVAWHPKSSTLNERTSIVIEDNATKNEILVRQIAGAVARRIVHYTDKIKIAKQGEKFGFIKFGSRIDLYLPLDTKINCKINDIVTGSITKLAEF